MSSLSDTIAAIEGRKATVDLATERIEKVRAALEIPVVNNEQRTRWEENLRTYKDDEEKAMKEREPLSDFEF